MWRGFATSAVIAGAMMTAAIVSGCHQARVPSSSPSSVVAHEVPSTGSGPSISKEDRSPPSHPLVTLSRRTIGPFLARQGDGGLAAWISPAERGDNQDLLAIPLSQDGAALAAPRIVAHVPADATLLVVRGAAGASGWLLAWTSLLDRGESLSVLALSQDAKPVGDPFELDRTTDHIRWVDELPGSKGALVLWAEETADGRANMLAVPIGFDGKPKGQPARVASGVDRWQAVRNGDGAALALVGPRTGSDGATVETLTWQPIGADAHLAGTNTLVARGATLGGDIDVVPIADGWLLGWTDRTGRDAHVMLATVAPSGRVRGPSRAMNSPSGSVLVALASGPQGCALAWREPGPSARENQGLHVALVKTNPDLAAEKATTFELAAGGSPELVGTSSGFALLGMARPCEATAQGRSCGGPFLPTFVRMGANLEPAQTDPLRVGSDRGATALGWGLGCVERDHCWALAATDESPTSVYTVDLRPGASSYLAPLPPLPPASAPVLAGIATVAAGDAYDDVADVRIGNASLLLTLSTPPEPERSHRRSQGSSVALRVTGPDLPTVDPIPFTTRAVSMGGVAMAAGRSPDDGALAAWIERDAGESEVRLVRLDSRGRRGREAHLATSDGANSVALTWADGGWIVGWVAPRDGNGEVFAARADRSLRRIGKPVRVTQAAGDASDVALAASDSACWIAWSDPRDSPRDGMADIFAATLRPEDASLASQEVRVLATARHSRSPKLVAASARRALVAWVEDAPTGLEGPGAAMAAELDESAHVIGTPRELPMAAAGRPVALAFAPSADSGIRAIIARATAEGISLDGLRFGADGAPRDIPWPLVNLDAPAAFDVAMALDDDGLVFDDVGPEPQERLIRRASLRW